MDAILNMDKILTIKCQNRFGYGITAAKLMMCHRFWGSFIWLCYKLFHRSSIIGKTKWLHKWQEQHYLYVCMSHVEMQLQFTYSLPYLHFPYSNVTQYFWTSLSNRLLNANLCWEMVQVSVIKWWGTEWERDERLGTETTDKQEVFHPKYYYQ